MTPKEQEATLFTLLAKAGHPGNIGEINLLTRTILADPELRRELAHIGSSLGVEMTPATSVWAPWRFNLGDHWATINYLITRSWLLKEEILLSRYQHGQDFKTRFEEILNLLDAPKGAKVVIVDYPGTHEPEGEDVWTSPYWPTKVRWAPGRRFYGTYQFDGISSAKDKNPYREDEVDIVETIHDLGLSPLRLGKHLSLWECATALSNSGCFVGCDSGMSHLAHSVGVPMYLVEYKLPIITAHRNKHFIHCRGTDELIAALKRDL